MSGTMLGGTKEVYAGAEEIAAFLRVSPPVLRRWIKDGLVDIRKMGKSFTATREQLLEIVRNGVDDSEAPEEIPVFNKEGKQIGTVARESVEFHDYGPPEYA